MPKLVVLDMDGTLADTKSAIFECYRAAARRLGRPEPSDAVLQAHLGGGLPDNMADIFGFGGEDLVTAVNEYRSHYSGKVGEPGPYEGMREAVDRMRAAGATLSIATMKAEPIAVEQVEAWGMRDRFLSVVGSDPFDGNSKADMIRRCLREAGASPEECVMVGDTENDRRAADAAGVGFVAAAYGFWFTPEICEAEGIPYAAKAADIPRAVEEAMARGTPRRLPLEDRPGPGDPGGDVRVHHGADLHHGRPGGPGDIRQPRQDHHRDPGDGLRLGSHRHVHLLQDGRQRPAPPDPHHAEALLHRGQGLDARRDPLGARGDALRPGRRRDGGEGDRRPRGREPGERAPDD